MKTQSYDRDTPRLHRVFSHALLAVTSTWLVATFVLSSLTIWLAPQHFAVVTSVALLSGLVAVIALLPGLLAAPPAVKGDYSTPLLASVILRILGTVALFLLCRYHLAASDDLLAGNVVGWYLFLTVIEVTALVRFLPQRDDFAADLRGHQRAETQHELPPQRFQYHRLMGEKSQA